MDQGARTDQGERAPGRARPAVPGRRSGLPARVYRPAAIVLLILLIVLLALLLAG